MSCKFLKPALAVVATVGFVDSQLDLSMPVWYGPSSTPEPGTSWVPTSSCLWTESWIGRCRSNWTSLRGGK